MPAPPSPERMSRLVGLIYDCVIEPSHWQLAMDSLRSSLGFATAEVAVLRLPDGEALMAWTSGIPPEWIQPFQEARAAGLIDLWGGPERVRQYPLAEPIVLSQAVERGRLDGNPLHERFAKPFGLSDLVGMALVRDADAVAGIGLGWAHGAITDGHIAPLRMLAPHMLRALTISRLMHTERQLTQTFAQALDALASAMLLVNEQLCIVHANAAADALLSEGDALTMQPGRRLHLCSPRAHHALSDTIARITAGSMTLGQRGIGIPLTRASGTAPLILHVLPLKAGELHSGLPQRAVAALFIADAGAPAPMPAQALALLYELTPAEVRVFELITHGHTPTEIATLLGLSASTVKTHLLRVFDKTGCRRQAELVRLAAALAAA